MCEAEISQQFINQNLKIRSVYISLINNVKRYCKSCKFGSLQLWKWKLRIMKP